MASFPPPDQHKTSSMVAGWPVVAFNNPFDEEELKNFPPAIVGSDGVFLIPPPLSSQASMGGSSKKVSKRRLKPATKPPIRVLSTDTSNFREIVHELTGMQPTSPLTQGIRFQQLWGNNPSPVLKPNATCSNSQHDAAGAAVAQILPPALEYTSAAYDLLPPQKALMHDEINNINIDLAFRQSLQHPQPHMPDGSLCNSTAFYTDERGYYHPSSSGVDLKPLFARQCNASKNTSMCMERAVGEVSPEMLDMEQVLQPAELESLLIMGDNNQDDLFPCKVLHNVDSWLPSDAIHMELAYAMTFYGSLANYCEGD